MLNIQIENLPKLRMSNSQTRSQVSQILSARHKNKVSFDSIFEKTELLSTPNRVRKKDHLSLLDESLDTKEISLRNTSNSKLEEEFKIYREHLELLSVYVKSSNPILAFSINRGISGCAKAMASLEQQYQLLKSKPPPPIALEKKLLRDTQVQTIKPEDEWKEMHKKDLKIFRHLEKKLEEININKVSQKLRELHRALKRAVSEVPALSKFPEIAIFNLKETINNLEKHVVSFQNDLSEEIVKRKIAALPIPVATQTEVPLIDPEKFFILEKMLIDKEHEIFDLKKKIEIMEMDKKLLNERYETSQSYLSQCEKLLYKAREKEAKFDRVVEETELEKKKFEKKLAKKREKLSHVKRDSINNAFYFDKQRKHFSRLIEDHKEAVISQKKAEIKLNEIKKAWEDKLGEPFQFSRINAQNLINSVNSSFQEKFNNLLEIKTGGSKENSVSPNPENKIKTLNLELTEKEESKSPSVKKSEKTNYFSSQFLMKNQKEQPSTPKASHRVIKPKSIKSFSQGERSDFSSYVQNPNYCSENHSNLKQNFLSRLEKTLINEKSDSKPSVQSSTLYTEDSSNGSFYRKLPKEIEDSFEGDPKAMFDSLTEKLKNGEKLTNLQEKFLELFQGNALKNLIKEDPEEYFKNTYSLFNPNDELHSNILREFPQIQAVPRRIQFEIFSIMMEHEKMMCKGKCKHLHRVKILKNKASKLMPYPIRKRTVEF